jgi:hypothetical protein
MKHNKWLRLSCPPSGWCHTALIGVLRRYFDTVSAPNTWFLPVIALLNERSFYYAKIE